MNDIGRQIELMFNDIKQFFLNIWNDIYSFFSKSMGEEVANLFLIAIGAFLIIFLLLKFINRD